MESKSPSQPITQSPTHIPQTEHIDMHFNLSPGEEGDDFKPITVMDPYMKMLHEQDMARRSQFSYI